MVICALVCCLFLDAQVHVDPNKVLNPISDDMFGSCIEDVNHEIYGGLYGQRIFGERFEEPSEIVGPAGWRSLGGDWKSAGGEATCLAGSGPMLLLDGKVVSDGTVEARLTVRKGQSGSAGLMIRVGNATSGVDAFDGYEVAFQAQAGALALGRHRHDFRLLQAAPAPIATGESHLVRAVIHGPRIQVFLDGEAVPRLDFTDQDRPILTGAVALRSWQADCGFRDVKLSGVPVSMALESRGLSGMWDPVGQASYSPDRDAITGRQCQGIVSGSATAPVGIANRGLNRWGISIRRGQTMEGTITLRGDVGLAVVALQSADGGHTYASQQLPVSPKWRSISFHLTPSVTNPNARFVVLLNRPGRLYMDQATLLDGGRFRGLAVRGDIAQSMVLEGLTFLRYGGTMVNAPDYRWKHMIGDPSRRPSYEGHWYPYSTNGFGIFDFLNFCEAAHFRSAFAINIEETPQDAADLADYLAAPTTTRWGAQRAADGHPAAYHPEYIEIGNEEGIEVPPHAALLHYAERFRLLESAIHRHHPELKLVCAAWWTQGSPEMKPVFEAVDGRAAAWDIHVGSDDPEAGIDIDHALTQIEQSFKGWNPKTGLKVVVFEENGGLHNMQRALGHATTLNATRRHGSFVLADCPANCLQPWHQNDNGWDQGQIFFTPDRVWGMPPFYAQQLLSQDRQPLRVESVATAGLDVLATRSLNGKTVTLTVVNVASRPIAATVGLSRFQIVSSSAKCVSGGLDAVNSPSQPQRFSISVVPCLIHRNQVDLTFPAHSITSLRLLGSPVHFGDDPGSNHVGAVH